MKICMLSHTPLVGAPFRLSKALNLINVKCDLFTFHDYPNHLKGLFECGNKISTVDDIIDDDYDLVWVHNQLSHIEFKKLFNRYKNVAKVIQFHSGTLEAPLYDRSFHDFFVKFDLRLVVAQSWARMYPDALLIPNVVHVDKYLSNEFLICKDLIKGLFLPSHGSGGRFGFKDSKSIKKAINIARSNNKFYSIDIEVDIPNKPLKQDFLLNLRTDYHFNIDEVFSGGFHQVSLEALSVGSIAINDSDLFSDLSFTNAIEADERPPFLRVSEFGGLDSVFSNQLRDLDFVFDLISSARKYSDLYLSPARLAQIIVQRLERNL